MHKYKQIMFSFECIKKSVIVFSSFGKILLNRVYSDFDFQIFQLKFINLKIPFVKYDMKMYVLNKTVFYIYVKSYFELLLLI